MKRQLLKNRKKMIYDLICSRGYVPMRMKEIAMLLQLPKGKRSDLIEVLDSLEKDGKIYKNERGRYMKSKAAKRDRGKQVMEGIFISHPRGFGFVEFPDSGEEDLFIPEKNTGYAFHQDRVQVTAEPAKTGTKREGRVVKILEHTITEVIGVYQESRNFGFVIPDNQRILQDIFIPKEHTMGAKDGQKVVVKLTGYGDGHKSPEGRVQEILGYMDEKGVDILSVAKSYDIPMEFPERVMNQAERTPDHVLESDFAGRQDLRGWQMVTIDGEDAKDLDDAVSVTFDGEFYYLGVHIADVSNYVQGGSALDREALKRGTSVYLVDRVIPMLPKRLSNGICSLNAGEDRLALSCLMKVNGRGRVVDHEIAETVIRVDRRMSYTQVKKILEDKDEALCREYADFVPMFTRMAELSRILRANRSQRGAIDFEFPESKILLDDSGFPVDIKPYERNVATDLIEDFMLLANETVAKEYCKKEIPFLYRTHENPDLEKMEGVLSFVRSQGFEVQKQSEEITPAEIQKILEEVEDSPMEPLISRLLLRSMKQAKYTTGCSGHFGLAAKYYCHFTSPIRRYPDLQIHRIIRDDLRGRLKEERIEHYVGILEDVAKQCSSTERRAEEAERETDKLKKAQYMLARVGQEFDGVISGVTGWGIYVELPNTVEGLVHMNTMYDDFYIFDEEQYQIVGERTKKTYRLGQKVRVRMENADLFAKTIDFVLV